MDAPGCGAFGDSPFGSDADTRDEVFASRFQFSELSLVGINKGINLAFAHNSFEGGKSKYGYFEEIVPDLLQYSGSFQTRDDGLNGDGISDTGRMLSHEYDLQDYLAFLGEARVPEPGVLAFFLAMIPLLRRRGRTGA